jgi:hypothetical protein
MLVAPVRLLERVEHRPQLLARVAQQADVKRHGREPHERQHRRVHEHQHRRDDQLRDSGQRDHAVLHEQLANLLHAREPALDIAGPP